MDVERCAVEQRRPPLGAWVGGGVVAGLALAVGWLRLGLPRPICVLRESTGIPCPTCGSTRAIEALAAGDFAGAVGWNPLFVFGLVAVAAWAAVSAVRWALGLPCFRIVLTRREHRGVWLLAGTVLLASWIYLVWRGV